MCLCFSGNKGGVGISLFFGNISLGFICTHLTSGNEKSSRYDPIARFMVLQYMLLHRLEMEVVIMFTLW